MVVARLHFKWYHLPLVDTQLQFVIMITALGRQLQFVIMTNAMLVLRFSWLEFDAELRMSGITVPNVIFPLRQTLYLYTGL